MTSGVIKNVWETDFWKYYLWSFLQIVRAHFKDNDVLRMYPGKNRQRKINTCNKEKCRKPKKGDNKLIKLSENAIITV